MIVGFSEVDCGSILQAGSSFGEWSFLHRGKCKALQMGRFTLIELLVVVAIISLLASMLLPALSKSRAVAKRIECVGQSKQMLTAHFLYSDDYDGAPVVAIQVFNDWNWGPATNWSKLLLPYAGNDVRVFHCSAAIEGTWGAVLLNDPEDAPHSWTYNRQIGYTNASDSGVGKWANIANPEGKVVQWEKGHYGAAASTSNWWAGSNGFPQNNPDWSVPHVNLSYVMPFADGHVSVMSYEFALLNGGALCSPTTPVVIIP
ncbi:hypothetical protein BVY04_03390 [bacterium M21]|nr:hypothetical protein BVY04_03390 [bacterium M21]